MDNLITKVHWHVGEKFRKPLNDESYAANTKVFNKVYDVTWNMFLYTVGFEVIGPIRNGLREEFNE